MDPRLLSLRHVVKRRLCGRAATRGLPAHAHRLHGLGKCVKRGRFIAAEWGMLRACAVQVARVARVARAAIELNDVFATRAKPFASALLLALFEFLDLCPHPRKSARAIDCIHSILGAYHVALRDFVCAHCLAQRRELLHRALNRPTAQLLRPRPSVL